MAAVGCRKSAIFGVGSNPWGLRHPQNQKIVKKCKKKLEGRVRFELPIKRLASLTLAPRPLKC